MVAERVPVIEDAMGAGAEEAGAEDDIGAIDEDGLDEDGVLGGIVFEIGVLDDHEIGGGLGNAGAESGAFARLTSWRKVLTRGSETQGLRGRPKSHPWRRRPQ